MREHSSSKYQDHLTEEADFPEAGALRAEVTNVVADPYDPEYGATTAEYAILTLAAVAFAGVMAIVVKSGPVQSLLQGLIEKALAG